MRFNLLDLLLPRETKFYGYLSEQAANLLEASETYRSAIGELKDSEKLRNRLVRLKELERIGDSLERRILEELDSTFITPLDREDIHQLATRLEKVTDRILGLSNKFVLYEIRKTPAGVSRLSDILVDISRELKRLFDALPKRDGVQDIIISIHVLEKQGDEAFLHAVADLFTPDTSPLFLIKFKEIYELLEQVIDNIDGIGKIVRGIMVKLG